MIQIVSGVEQMIILILSVTTMTSNQARDLKALLFLPTVVGHRLGNAPWLDMILAKHPKKMVDYTIPSYRLPFPEILR
jgi:hypothetical protein